MCPRKVCLSNTYPFICVHNVQSWFSIMSMTDLQLRMIFPQKMRLAATKCISEAGKHISQPKFSPAIPFIEILEVLPLGTAELTTDLCELLCDPQFSACPNQRVKSLTSAIVQNWFAKWSTGDSCDPVTSTPVAPLRPPGFNVGDSVLLNLQTPAPCIYRPGSVVTVIGDCSEQFPQFLAIALVLPK